MAMAVSFKATGLRWGKYIQGEGLLIEGGFLMPEE
jgi:hypothetical protein